MTREELEEEVFKRLHIGKESDIPIIRDALKRQREDETLHRD